MITVTTDMAAFGDKFEARATAHAAKYGYDKDSSLNNLDALLAAAKRTPDFAEACAWYPSAMAECARLAARYGIPLTAAVAAVAACSPQLAWTQANGRMPNLEVADHIIKVALRNPDVDPATLLGTPAMSKMDNGMGVQQTGPNKLRAILAARGDSPASVLRGLKVRSFYNNLINPGADYHTTIDTHMLRAALNDTAKTLGGDTVSALVTAPGCKAIDTVGTVGTYPLFADDIRTVASAHGMLANAAQAAMWIHWRKIT